MEVSKAYYELGKVDSEFLKGKRQFSYIDIFNLPLLTFPVTHEETKNLKFYVDKTIKAYNKNFAQLNESLRILALGIDYRKYMKLKSFVPPTTMKDRDGIYHTVVVKNVETITSDDLVFAIDFVLECSLQLQNFKFN